MQITKTSDFTGKEHSLDLPVTQEQLDNWTSGRMLIQEAMPHLSDDQREFLMTGCTPEEWDEAMGPEDDEVEEGFCLICGERQTTAENDFMCQSCASNEPI